MGLAASQARLLTITARKSDCEYQSMNYSHQKIALSRDMNIVSAEYQDALSQTKLVYDYYGTGDTSTQLSYGLLMQPSKLNNYMPSPITDPAGRVVLDSKLAAAAEAAGIPQEGLGTTPSSDIRNRFIQGLMDAGVVTETVGKGIQSVQYNPDAGLGSTDLIKYNTTKVSYDDFVDKYLANIKFNFSDLLPSSGGSDFDLWVNGNKYADECPQANVTLKDILTQNIKLVGLSWDHKDMKNNGFSSSDMVDKVGSSSYWDTLFETLSSYLDPTDSYTQAALEYAKKETLRMVESYGTDDFSNAALKYKSGHKSSSKVYKQVNGDVDNYVGYIYCYNKSGGKDYNDGYGLNISNMTKAYLTYFAQYMDGVATSDYSVNKEKGNSNFIDNEFVFNVVESADTSGDNLLIANFYDTLFNQIATKGWVKNDKVDDNEYLQTMLQNGSMYISTVADDDYYYQDNYATNSYIKEITDEEGIAQAEAKYNREKEKINAKENTIDMKMKNLDTEISSLTTEYDTVKSVISKNVERAFKRYNA